MSAFEQLRTTNQLIRSFLETDIPEGSGDLEQAWDMVSEISQQINSVGALLSDGTLHEGASEDVEDQVKCYRVNIERLQTALTSIQDHLRSERDALLLRNRHLSAAGKWATNAMYIE
jgi:hypothetical protein